jgi:hypothetical protein
MGPTTNDAMIIIISILVLQPKTLSPQHDEEGYLFINLLDYLVEEE